MTSRWRRRRRRNEQKEEQAEEQEEREEEQEEGEEEEEQTCAGETMRRLRMWPRPDCCMVHRRGAELHRRVDGWTGHNKQAPSMALVPQVINT